jgi:hypothetical protein
MALQFRFRPVLFGMSTSRPNLRFEGTVHKRRCASLVSGSSS